jgi:hypothetical protein
LDFSASLVLYVRAGSALRIAALQSCVASAATVCDRPQDCSLMVASVKRRGRTEGCKVLTAIKQASVLPRNFVC